MSGALPYQDAVASAAFQRYAEAHTRMQETQQLSDVRAARRAYRRFLEAFLSPEEQAGMDEVGLPTLRAWP